MQGKGSTKGWSQNPCRGLFKWRLFPKSNLAKSRDADLFSGFWLRGGGGPCALPPHFTKKRVVLEVG